MTALEGAPGSAPVTAYETARIELARLSVSHERPLRLALRLLAEAVSDALGVARVSIWMLVQEDRAICCEFLYQPATRDVFEGVVLHARDFPAYFSALSARRVVAVSDIGSDPITEEFRRPYFEPLGIGAMLDAPIYRDGRVVGIVCHEHIGAARLWSEAECEFAANVADIIARIHAEAERLQAESTLGSFQSHVMELQRAGTMGRLAAGMAHDFRNILGAITGFADLMISSAGHNPELQGYGQDLHEAVDKGTRLTQELLTLSQEMPCRPAVTDMRAVLLRYQNLLGMALGSGVHLQLELADEVCRVFVDAAQIERAILNLVVNANDAMPDGGTVTLRLFEGAPQADADGHYLVIEVADTGHGMDVSTRELMFEPFFTTKGDSGTGLGLSIVQQIIHHAGGHIEVDSTPGRGTRLRLLLPAISGAH